MWEEKSHIYSNAGVNWEKKLSDEMADAAVKLIANDRMCSPLCATFH